MNSPVVMRLCQAPRRLTPGQALLLSRESPARPLGTSTVDAAGVHLHQQMRVRQRRQAGPGPRPSGATSRRSRFLPFRDRRGHEWSQPATVSSVEQMLLPTVDQLETAAQAEFAGPCGYCRSSTPSGAADRYGKSRRPHWYFHSGKRLEDHRLVSPGRIPLPVSETCHNRLEGPRRGPALLTCITTRP